MGRFSDILEENSEALDPWSRLHDPVGTAAGGDRPRNWVLPQPVFPCPSCGQVYASDPGLRQHLFDRHRTDRFYVRVNDRPVPDISFVDEAITSIKVVPLGSEAVHAVVSRDGQLIGRLAAVPGIQTELAPDPIESGAVRIELEIAGRRTLYTVFVRQLPAFDPSALDAAIQAAQEPLDRGLLPEWHRLAAASAQLDVNSLERRYLDGFVEYLLAAELDLRRDFLEAGHGLERAWGYLRPFRVGLARSAISILAFRFDAFEFLTSPASQSSLGPIAGYLMSPPRPSSSSSETSSTDGIWIDGYQERLILAATLALDGRFVEAQEALRGAPADLREAAGNARKQLILTARIAHETGDSRAARAAYSALRVDPLYGEEAEAHLA